MTTAQQGQAGSAGRRSRRGVEQLMFLTLGILLGILGFAASLFWYGALVVMAICWGFQLANLRPASGRAGGALPASAALIEEARGLAHELADAAHLERAEHDPPADQLAPAPAPAAADLTRDELYQLAKAEGIAGRSRMSKADLRRALTRRSRPRGGGRRGTG